MHYPIMALFFHYWPIVLFVAFFGFLLSRGASKKREELAARNKADAGRLGMDYTPPAEGEHRFSGTTRGVAWTAEVTLLTSEVADGLATRRSGTVRYTRWTAPGAGTGGGELLLMALPDGVRPPPATAGAGGFFAGLAAKAAWAASQVYIRLNFGNARADSLTLTPENHLPLPGDAFGSAFTAFGNRPELLERLSPPAREMLLKARDARAAFLWDTQGLSLTWPTAHIKPEEVAACAEYGALLAGLIR